MEYEISGQKLREARLAKGLTLDEARLAINGKTYNKLWCWENMPVAIKATELRALCDLLEINMMDLFQKKK